MSKHSFVFCRSERGWIGFKYFAQESGWQMIRRLWLGYWWIGWDTRKEAASE